MRTPILNEDTQQQIDRAISQYTHTDLWRNWGLSTLRDQGACILLDGPPGTGKTTVAEYVALKVRKKGIKAIDFAEFGSQVPGENSRQIRRLFKEAKENGGMTIFLDEVEAVLWSRDKIAGSNTWMLEVIDTLLAEIAAYKYLIIMATNRPDMLDAAIMRRLIARITVGLPTHTTREKLWKSKWPAKMPLKLTAAHIEKLAEQTDRMTGATIERIIINAGSRAMMAKRLPLMDDLLAECQLEQQKLA